MNESFTERVLAVVSAIPKGDVLTYSQVAKLAGSEGAARAVGTIMKNNYNERIPCHRVVQSSGKVGEYNRGGSVAKYGLLISEGVDPTRIKR